MTRSRVELHEILCGICGNVYYQTPETTKMVYPCIRYSRSRIQNRRADNDVYGQTCVYEVIVIDKNPDSQIVAAVSVLPHCRHDRHYVSDNLNHDVFTLYY